MKKSLVLVFVLVFFTALVAAGCGSTSSDTPASPSPGGSAGGSGGNGGSSGGSGGGSGGSGGSQGGAASDGSAELTFGCVVMDYDAGYGVEGQDEIAIESITGPSGATVDEPLAGEYVVTGTYKLTNYTGAVINVGFLGSAQLKPNATVEQEIVEGEGNFEVKETLIKIEDGPGNLIIDMAGDSGGGIYSDWMFRVLPAVDVCAG